jgi:hypothetical protein
VNPTNVLVHVIPRPVHPGDIQTLSALPQGGPLDPFTSRVDLGIGLPASVRGEHLSGTTAHLLESCRSVDAIPTHLCPQSQTDRAGFDAVFDCSTEESYIDGRCRWTYSVEHDDAGQAAFNAHDCEDFPLPLLEWLA